MQSMPWSQLVDLWNKRPNTARARDLDLTRKAMNWEEISREYWFVPLVADGQWLTCALVTRNSEPEWQVFGSDVIRHAPMVQVNIQQGKPAFYAVVPDVLARGAHQYNFGSSFLMPEPILGVPVPSGISGRDVRGNTVDLSEFLITGVIVKDEPSDSGKVVKRTNLTMLRENLAENGTLVLDSVTYYLYGLLKPDENRLAPNRVNAYFSQKPCAQVVVKELASVM